MDMDQAHRTANLYDAAWEIVREGTGEGITVPTRARFVGCWGSNAVGKDDETLIHWAKNFLRHNARPNV